MSRRLPVYLLIDTSGSMDGDPINAVNNGLQMLVSNLKKDPRTRETAHISVIEFNSEANQILPLTVMSKVILPVLKANGVTELGKALDLVEKCISKEVVPNSTEGQKGDYRPLIFLFTDGQPSNVEWRAASNKLKSKKYSENMICCAAGHDADESLLKEISNIVLKLEDLSDAKIAEFFKLLTQSVLQTTVSKGTNHNGGIIIPDLPPGIQIV